MDEPKTYEDLTALQRKEKKDLLGQIQKMKHGIPKGDKKKKKEITAEVAQLLADLEMKHEEQLKKYEAPAMKEKEESVELSVDEKAVDCPKDTENRNGQDCSEVPISLQKISKAQKRRNKKAQHMKEREQAILDQEQDNLTGLRHMESLEINKKLTERGLVIYEIPSDGNCLYKAIEHQLSMLNLMETSVTALREKTSEYLLTHKEDYLPFLTHSETGDILTNEQFEKYCDDIVNTPAWGGHVEIKVLSCLLGKPIEVIQANSPSIIVGDENVKPELIISYHRYVYSLGEHYNSTIPISRLPDATL